MDVLDFKINNWDKYNPRNDRKNYTWFRFENGFFIDPIIFGLKNTDKLLLIYLFCEASKKGEGSGALNLDMASHMIGCKVLDLKKSLQVLINKGFILIDDLKTAGDAIKTTKGIATNVTNERTKRTNTTTLVFDFENIYKGYPFKEGKQKGMQLLQKSIITQEQYDSFCIAVKNYAECKKGSKYLFKFNNFVKDHWQDFIEIPETPQEEKGTYDGRFNV